ncbi:hypothetical protein AAFF_G00114370 [Aldrovandia affinis]|uniref:CW-type domain-containing protein n=1 Tax=Aldrovandia affinis TaxID=143900 RepID=A0AAD7RSS7_9TELE|nr:hypothetical protein AAFF_G00114370 [Aldrovandia affinis]
MAAQTERGIPLSALSPKFLHTNSTSHTWPFSAIAELIDNAYDPDVSAKQFWIDKTRIKGLDCLTFMDNGAGMNYDKMHKMLSFGFSDKQAINGHVPVGLYGNGFKSGSMRLGKDAIVFSKTRDTMCVGLLSQSYLEAIRANHVVVPIVTFARVGHNQALSDHAASLQDILRYSLFKTEAELFSELRAINATCSTGSSGTRVIIWNLRRMSAGRQTEFDFNVNRYDIQIPADIYESTSEKYKRQERPMHSVPRATTLYAWAYCSILYLKPRMQIVIRGQKVKTQLISKSLAYIAKDHYRPIFLNKRIRITFGYNTKSKEQYGMMMYHKNRLIKAYERVGCQLKANNRGVGVIGVIECNFLKPTHNKQDFDYTDEYRKTINNLGVKLEEYWNEIRYKRDREDPNCTIPVEDTMKRPDQNWVQCDNCLKWRKVPDGIDCSLLPEKWVCHMNPDPQFRNCLVQEEPEDSDDDQPSYQKTYKQQERYNRMQQERNRQQMEQAKKKVEMQRIAALAQQNEALRRQHEDLKRQLKQSNFQVNVPRTTIQTQHSVSNNARGPLGGTVTNSNSTPHNLNFQVNVPRTTAQTQHSVSNNARGPLGGTVTNSAPHSSARGCAGHTHSSSTMPIISNVCSLSTPSRMKRTTLVNPDSAEAKRARMNGQHGVPAEVCPSSPVIIPDDDDDDILIVESSSTPRPGQPNFDLTKVKTEQRPGGDPAGMHMECSDDAAVEVPVETAATATVSSTGAATAAASTTAIDVTATFATATATTATAAAVTAAAPPSPPPQQQVSATTQTERSHAVKDEEEEKRQKEREGKKKEEGTKEGEAAGREERESPPEEERKEGEPAADEVEEMEVEEVVVKVEREAEEDSRGGEGEAANVAGEKLQTGAQTQAEGAAAERVRDGEGAGPREGEAAVAAETKDRLLSEAQLQQDQLMELMQSVATERDDYQAQVHRLTCQVVDLEQQLARAVVKKEPCDAAAQTERDDEEEGEGEEVRRLYQLAKQEVEELKRELETQEGAGAKKEEEEEEDDTKAMEEDELAVQMDSLLRDLDRSNRKRDDLQSQLESLEAERGSLASQCEQLRRELKELRARNQPSGDEPAPNPPAEEGSSNGDGPSSAEEGESKSAGNPSTKEGESNGAGNPSRPASPQEIHRLRALRQNIGRLLVTFVPALDLDQVNYDCDVIDEILEQVLDEVSSTETAQNLPGSSPTS